MDSDGVVVDNAREPDVSDEEVLKWYTNMLTGMNILGKKAREQKSLMRRGPSQLHSQHNGPHHVRCPKARSSELLHGTLLSSFNRKNDDRL